MRQPQTRRPYLWRTSVAIAVVTIAIAVVTFVYFARLLGAVAGGWGTSRDADFERDRAGLDAIVAWVRSTKHESDYYTALPEDLAYLSSSEKGNISIWAKGAVFVPQWSGMPDDAGGYIYMPHHSPEGWDMWGMECEAPAELEGGWWECGMGHTTWPDKPAR